MNSVILNMTRDNFNEYLDDQNKRWFLIIFAEWCPHCRHFLPKLNELIFNITNE